MQASGRIDPESIACRLFAVADNWYTNEASGPDSTKVISVQVERHLIDAELSMLGTLIAQRISHRGKDFALSHYRSSTASGKEYVFALVYAREHPRPTS